MRKPAFSIGENKGADQLRGNREADQRLSFRYRGPASRVGNRPVNMSIDQTSGQYRF